MFARGKVFNYNHCQYNRYLWFQVQINGLKISPTMWNGKLIVLRNTSDDQGPIATEHKHSRLVMFCTCTIRVHVPSFSTHMPTLTITHFYLGKLVEMNPILRSVRPENSSQ